MRIPIPDPDCLDAWTLSDVNLIVDKESKDLLTEAPVGSLFSPPLGTKDQPVELCTGHSGADGPRSRGECVVRGSPSSTA